MESRAFINSAKTLIAEIEEFSLRTLTNEDEGSRGQVLQRNITALFSGLQNPTLPSAYKLRDVAQAAGFVIDSRVLQRLSSLENA